MSFGVSVGVNTLSMTWMTPLLVATSGRVTVAPLTVTASPTPKERVSPLTAVAVPHSATSEDGTFPDTTW